MNHLINRCVKSEFNDISLYMKKDSERRRLSAYVTNYWVYIYFIDVFVKIAYFTIRVTNVWLHFLWQYSYCIYKIMLFK